MTSTVMLFCDGPLRGQRRIEPGEWREWKVPVIKRQPVTYYEMPDPPPGPIQIEYVVYGRIDYNADADAMLYRVKSAPAWWSDSLLNDRFRTD